MISSRNRSCAPDVPIVDHVHQRQRPAMLCEQVLDSFSSVRQAVAMPDLCPASDAAAVRILAEALRESGGRPLTREADLFLATVAAECLYDRLALAGVVLLIPAA
jgi:hypothetical protein